MKKQELVIISGVTGTIGSRFWQHYITKKNVLTVGISRKGISLPGSLYPFPAIYCVDMQNNDEIQQFIDSITLSDYSAITYIHAVGEFKTELSDTGNVIIENDNDNDGIDDTTYQLIYQSWVTLYTSIRNSSSDIPIHTCLFGSLTDKYKLKCFFSFSQSQNYLRKFINARTLEDKNLSAVFTSISTLLSPQEMIARPFIGSIFSDYGYWLPVGELIKRVIKIIKNSGIQEIEVYRSWPNFEKDYLTNEKKVIERRMIEKYGVRISKK